MLADPLVFRDLAYVFIAAVVGGALAWLLRQPLVVGYVAGGILISPLTPGPAVSDIRTFELFAEIGVVLLMFSIGMEFSFKDLLKVKWLALLGAPLGLALSVGLALAVGLVSGWPPLQGVVVGIVVSVASTMVMVRLLMESGELRSQHGRIMIGITLVEDLAVVALIVLIPALGALEPGRLLAIASALGKSILILLPFGYVAAKVAPAIMTRVARTRNDEMFLLVALAVGIGTAALTQAVGLSLALGAFLAGLLINQSDYAHETLERILPVRDAFVALFFVTIGALIDPAPLFGNLPLLGTMLALVVVGKLALRTAVVLLFGQPLRTAVLVGVGFAQIGEFSFILVQVARTAGHVGADVYNATLATAAISILLNAGLVRTASAWLGFRRGPRRPEPQPATAVGAHEVVLCGFGRVGSAVGEALEAFGVRHLVIERDPAVVAGLRARGVTCLFGDAASRRTLEAAHLPAASLAIVTLPDADRARLAVHHIRALHPGLPVLARAHDPGSGQTLAEAGASEVIQPELEAAATLIERALERLALPGERVLAYLDRFRAAMGRATTVGPAASNALPDLVEVSLGPAALADQSLREARIRERLGVTVVAIMRAGGDLLLNPPPETIMRAGDRLRIFGLPEQIEAFRAEAAGAPTPQ